MYEAFYGLRERPFDLTANPRFLFLTAGHREALSNLHYGLSSRTGITLLVGEAGAGKTTIIRAAIAHLRSPSSRIAYVSNPTLTRPEFFELLAGAFGLSPEAAASKPRFLDELLRRAMERDQEGGLTALVVDEAQSLPHELLEEIRLLSNLETSTTKLVPIVLAGQPELAERLNDTSLRQLKQRIGLRCTLPPLGLRETAAYIGKRIRIAGGEGALVFTREAVETIYDRSGGIPRIISVLCDNALVTGFALGRKPVGADVVAEVGHDFDFTPAASPPSDGPEAPAGERLAFRVVSAVDPDQDQPAADARLTAPHEAAPEPDSEDGAASAVAAPSARDYFSAFTKRRRFFFFGMRG
jgi:general secretion pathway protein A